MNKRNNHGCIYTYSLRNSGMALPNGSTTLLETPLQKGLRYKHHHRNYEKTSSNGMIPSGLRTKESPAFVPVTEDFNSKWDQVL